MSWREKRIIVRHLVQHWGMASVEALQEQESGDIQEMQSQIGFFSQTGLFLPNSLDKGTKTSLCVCVWCRTTVLQWWERTAESRNHCSLTCRSQLSSTTLSMHRSRLLVPSVIWRHQEGELLSKCFYLKLQMLPTAFQCQPCPALCALQRWGIRRHSMSCSLCLLPATEFITRHHSRSAQFAATRQNLFQSNGSQKSSLSKHSKVLSATSL